MSGTRGRLSSKEAPEGARRTIVSRRDLRDDIYVDESGDIDENLSNQPDTEDSNDDSHND